MVGPYLIAAWYDRIVDLLPWVPIALAVWAVFGGLRSGLRRTVWRRRDWYRRLKRLGTNAQLSYFTSVLGEPPATRRTFQDFVSRYDDQGQRHRVPKVWIETVYVDRNVYVQALADTDETVHAYSVTTRNRWFRPKFRRPGGWGYERRWVPRRWSRWRWGYRPDKAIKLGRTRFEELGRPQQAAAWVGAHNAHYFEAYYFGNPGYYQTFVYSINDAGARAWKAPWPTLGFDFAWGFAALPLDPKLALAEAAAIADAEGVTAPSLVVADEETPADEDEELRTELEMDLPEEEPLPDNLQTFRSSARINTYTVISPELALDDYPGAEGRLDTYPITFGVNSGRVRTLDRE